MKLQSKFGLIHQDLDSESWIYKSVYSKQTIPFLSFKLCIAIWYYIITQCLPKDQFVDERYWVSVTILCISVYIYTHTYISSGSCSGLNAIEITVAYLLLAQMLIYDADDLSLSAFCISIWQVRILMRWVNHGSTMHYFLHNIYANFITH